MKVVFWDGIYSWWGGVKIVEITTRDLEYYLNLVGKVGLERIDSSFRRGSTVCKMLSNSTTYYREIIHERKSHSMWKTLLLSHFINRHTHLNPQPLPPWSVRSHQHQGKTLPQQKDYNLLKVCIMVRNF